MLIKKCSALFWRPTFLKKIFRELLSTSVIEKQPSAIVKRNVEKYAVPAAVSQGGFFRSTENNSRSVGDQYDGKGGEVEDEQRFRGLKSSLFEKNISHETGNKLNDLLLQAV